MYRCTPAKPGIVRALAASGIPRVTARLHRYRQLAAALADALRAGRYPPVSRLPSVRELCAEHGASLATVTHALQELEDAGLIEARPRRGFFVRAAGKPPAADKAGAALELEGRRKRLMTLAAAHPGLLTLGHLALPPELLPLSALRRLLGQQLGVDLAALATGSVFGSDALREQLARRAPRMGCDFAADDIVVTQGEGESLQLCLGLLARPGDTVAITSPAPLRALELIVSLGLHALELPADGTLAVLEDALRRQPVAACIADSGLRDAAAGPHGDADKAALADLLARHALPLIECDMLGELHRGAYRPRPLKAFDEDDRVLYCGSFACITGTGCSVGYVASRRHHLQLRAARAIHGELVPALTEQVLAAFMAAPAYDAHLRRLRKRLATQVELHRRAIVRHFPAGTRVTTGEGGHVLWVELPGGLDAARLLERARERGYTFVPGAVFSAGTGFDHCLRLTAGHPLDAARERGIAVLGEIAAVLDAN